jgi:catechol 2,3-dioxygenase-like lactoylglutathione lyase family enzyme
VIPRPGPDGAAPLTGLSHVQLRVTDVAASATWYIRALGLEPYAEDLSVGYVALRHRGTRMVVVLTAAGDHPVGPHGGAGPLDHLAFAVPDGDELDVWARHLTAEGILHPGVVPEDGRPSLQLRDPDGVAIELVAPRPAAGSVRAAAPTAVPTTRPGRPLTPDQERAWEEDGWCILEGAVPEAELEAALAAVAHLFPDPEEMAGAMAADGSDRPGGPVGPAEGDHRRWRDWDAAWPEFPFRSRTLNGLVVGDTLIDLATQLLGTDDVRMYMALVSAKYAGQPSGYNQLLHTDFPNHTLTVPKPGAGTHQVEAFLYLCDVGPDNGATRFVSRTRTRDIPVEEHTLNLDDHAELYRDPSDASAPAGSVVVYRPDVYHRSVDFSDPLRWRVMLHVAYRPAGAEWGGYQAWPFKGFSPEWHDFVQAATPRQLGVLGFPVPGHPFWTAETLDGVGRRYPGLDLSPWQEAAGRRAP